MRLLEWAGIKTNGKTALVIGRSRNVGMLQAILLASRGADATVTMGTSGRQIWNYNASKRYRSCCSDDRIW